MKNNNKKRKLKFIREKNNLRLGITKFYCFEKVSNLLKDETLKKEYWERLFETAYKSLFKRYRLKLRTMKIIPNQLMDDDFVKDLHTNVIILSR